MAPKAVAAPLPAKRGPGRVHLVMLRFFQVGLLLITTSMASCISGEAECHKRAIALIACCPFCDENCWKHPEAKAVEDACLADLEARRVDDEQGDAPRPKNLWVV